MNWILASSFGLATVFLSATNADNTPNLCTADIKDLLEIAPSEASGLIPPNIIVGGFEYNGDANHFVIGAETSEEYDKVLVYLPGTTDRPELSSCLLKSVAESLPYPTIGLSYAYLSSGDSFRNGKCQYEGEKMNSIAYQIDCLTQQHIDAIDGGTYGSTHTNADGNPFWDPVAPDNSITARLGFLFKMLDGKYPNKKWGEFYTDGGSFPTPNWNRIKVMGHSQGAGHAAYLAQTQAILGAVMVSGPQDECIGCSKGTKFWIDKTSYKSKSYSAFASADEPLVGVMKDNWDRMTDAGATTWKKNFYTDVDFAVDTNTLNTMKGPLLSSILPAFTSTCGGKEHCSTAIDDSVPFIEKSNGDKMYLYSINVWPAISSIK